MLLDSGGPGKIGKMGGGLSSRHLFWRLVKNYGLSMSDVDGMSFDMMMEAAAYLDMCLDWKNAWQAYYEIEGEKKAAASKAVNNGYK